MQSSPEVVSRQSSVVSRQSSVVKDEHTNPVIPAKVFDSEGGASGSDSNEQKSER